MEEAPAKRDTKRIGDRSEIEVLAALAQAGYLVSVPFGENQRYDLIAEKNNVLIRVQVKTGRLTNGAIMFKCVSTHSHRNGVSLRKYIGEVEAFGVYCPDVEAVFLVPVQDVAVEGILRWLPPKNGQKRAIRWADRYLVARTNPKVGSSIVNGVTHGLPP
jgi:hypothetical protein